MRRSRSGDRIRRQWGRLLSVSEEEVTRRVLVDQAAGANTLTVDNGYIFGDKGWCQIGDQVTAHTGWDEDTQILTLVDDLAAAVEEGDRVGLWNHARDALVVELTAEVDRDGVRGVPLECDVDESLLDSLPVGPRDVGDGEDVLVEHDPEQDSWTIIRATGQSRILGLKHEPNDPHTLTTDEIADGLFTHALKHSGIAYDKALVCFVNGVAYGPDQLAIDSTNGIVDVTLGDWETVDEAVWFDYWYRNGAVTETTVDPPVPPTRVSIDNVFQDGWPGTSADTTYTLTGLQTGDLVVAVLRSASSTMDSRFTMVCDLGGVAMSGGTVYGKVWAATIGGDTSNVTFPHAGTVLRLRNGSGTPLELDGRVSLPDGTHAGGSGSIAALSGGGSGAVSAVLTGGAVGGAYGTTFYPSPWNAITGIDDTDGGTYGLVYLTWTDAETVGAIAAPQHDPNDGWRGCALGIGYA